MNKGNDPLMVSIWGAEMRPSESQTRYLGEICSQPSTGAALPFEMGEYSILRLLGRGGMGIVFEGEHRRMRRRVAIKVLNSSLAEASAAQEQFLSEIRAVARLLHPRIVTAFDAGQLGSVVYLVMEYIDGVPLNDWVSERGPLPAAESLAIIRQAAEGLSHAHMNNVVHRDVKPSNMMLSKDGSLKLLDLGLASLAQEVVDGGQDAEPQAVCGTPEFMAPEQFESRQITAVADVYALGCTLYFLLTGEPPYRGSFFELLQSHCGGKTPRLSERGVERADELQPLLAGMMAVRECDRIASMDEVIACIDILQPTKNRGFHSPRPTARSTIQDLMALINQSSVRPESGTGSGSKAGLSSRASGDSRPSGYEETEAVTPRVAIGVDLGGRYLSATTWRADEGDQSLSLGGQSDNRLRTAIAVSRSRGVVLGEKAWTRLLNGGSGCQDFVTALRDLTTIRLANESFSPLLGLSLAFQHIKEQALPRIPQGWEPSLIVTVPSTFRQASRHSICHAAELGGFSTIRLLDRNLAAALSQFTIEGGAKRATAVAPTGPWLVVSVDELTMEVALLDVQEDYIRVKSVAGDVASASPRWLRRLRRHLRQKLAGRGSSDSSDDAPKRSDLVVAVERAVEELASNDQPPIEFRWGAQRVRGALSTSMILGCCGDLVQRFGELLAQTLAEANTDGEHVAHCLVIGTLPRSQPLAGMLRSFGVSCHPVQVLPHEVTASIARWWGPPNGKPARHPQVIACNAHDIGLSCSGVAGGSEVSLVVPRLTALPAIVNRSLTPGRSSAMEMTVFESTSDADTVWDPVEKLYIDFPTKTSIESSIKVDDQGRVSCEIVGNESRRMCIQSVSPQEREQVQYFLRNVTQRRSRQQSGTSQETLEPLTEGSSF